MFIVFPVKGKLAKSINIQIVECSVPRTLYHVTIASPILQVSTIIISKFPILGCNPILPKSFDLVSSTWPLCIPTKISSSLTSACFLWHCFLTSLPLLFSSDIAVHSLSSGQRLHIPAAFLLSHPFPPGLMNSTTQKSEKYAVEFHIENVFWLL